MAQPAILDALRRRNQAAIDRMKAQESNEGLDQEVNAVAHPIQDREDPALLHAGGETVNINDIPEDDIRKRMEMRSQARRGPSQEEDDPDTEESDPLQEMQDQQDLEDQQEEEGPESSLHGKMMGDLARAKMGKPKRYGS